MNSEQVEHRLTSSSTRSVAGRIAAFSGIPAASEYSAGRRAHVLRISRGRFGVLTEGDAGGVLPTEAIDV